MGLTIEKLIDYIEDLSNEFNVYPIELFRIYRRAYDEGRNSGVEDLKDFQLKKVREYAQMRGRKP